MTIINESGVYGLIFGSKLPTYDDWIASKTVKTKNLLK
jgi:prophage antirepressor-like protein